MHGRKSRSFFSGAYSLAHADKLLRIRPFRTAFVSAYFLYKKWLEDPFWNLVRRNPELFRNGDILDIGANVGYTACLFAKALKTGSKVYAFEPDASNFWLLQEVVRRKNLSEKIVAINAAVGSADGSVEFWHNEKHLGDHRVATNHFKRSLPHAGPMTTVPLVALDSFIETKNLRNISLVKIDVQGFELAVCEGIERTLARCPDISVCVEFAPEALVALGFEPVGLLAFFRTRGYYVHILLRSGIQLALDDTTILRFADQRDYVDLLCSRKVFG